MKAVVHGVGAVGSRIARHLVSASAKDVILIDDVIATADAAVGSLGNPARVEVLSGLRLETRLDSFRKICLDVDTVFLTTTEDHFELAETALKCGANVVSVSDDLDVVKKLIELDDLAVSAGRNLVLGAGFAPGMTCLLALHGASWLDEVDEVHIAKFGTGGPECARQHHKALRSDAIEWRDKKWHSRRGGTGRELCWFPDPVGGLDCFHAAMADPLLLLNAFENADRISARVSATRRDMSTKWLPMLRKPHPEGTIGAVRVELRGTLDGGHTAVVLGALDRPAVAAGSVAAVAGKWAAEGRLKRPGAGGLADLVDKPVEMLHELAEMGVKAAVFEGISGV